jgi:predicted MFS family arabinose efflux permease
MHLLTVVHDWRNVFLALLALGAALALGSLLLPPDDVPEVWMDSYEG